jgi:hypothetical protein
VEQEAKTWGHVERGRDRLIWSIDDLRVSRVNGLGLGSAALNAREFTEQRGVVGDRGVSASRENMRHNSPLTRSEMTRRASPLSPLTLSLVTFEDERVCACCDGALLSEQKLFAPLGAKPSTRDLHLLAWVSLAFPWALPNRSHPSFPHAQPPRPSSTDRQITSRSSRPKDDIDIQPSHPPCSSGWIQRQARPSCLTFRLSERRLVCTDTRSAGRNKEGKLRGVRSCARGKNKDQGGRHGTAASNERIGQADKMEKESVPPTAYKKRLKQQLVKIVYMRFNATLHAA